MGGAWICNRRMELMDMVMLVLILVLGPVIGASAQNCSQYYDVGGSGQQWTNPANPDFYQSWASGIQFLPGDCILFNRITDGYIYEVSAQDYNSCNVSDPLAYGFGYANFVLEVGPFPSSLTYPQSYHFVEATNVNCTAGMKFCATVVDPSSVPPPPPTSGASTPPPPIPPISPPGPPRSPTPPLVGAPLVGEATKTKGNGSKLSAGAIAGITIGAVASALGVGGLAVRMNMALHCCPTINFNNYHGQTGKPVANGAPAEKTKAASLNPYMNGP